ncbi:thioredoxin [Cohnella xylanilytica]|uniref:aryl-sulfate sulfotransferase n=1 Tax=Cohnella xylanilytica TaxID=557555 RepID=UPI001B1779C3|nr:aryl-sulfate sulfotransferase [Cohnella xylanilytica]GIO14902.1 thioredoxin [Cohnella xylanilytica]
MGRPTIYPTGATLYDPERAWNGYTLYQAADLGALLIDMNGREVRLWSGLRGSPNKIRPGGRVMGSTALRDPRYGMQDQVDVVEADWNGRIVWCFDRHEYVEDPGLPSRWMARAHHDYQHSGDPVYYTPESDGEAGPASGPTLILAHRNVTVPAISDQRLTDDVLLETDEGGRIVWEWLASDHVDELGLGDDARRAMRRNPNVRRRGVDPGMWLHMNAASRIGPNRHYDQGDGRFHPDNILWSAREANVIAITDRASGSVVWKLGPDYSSSRWHELGWIIGPHHPHIIPRGLPGAGNLLLFDNGGWAGYGLAHVSSPDGLKTALRDYSRVLELDPTTFRVVWQYTPYEAGLAMPQDASLFYSPYLGSAQRLPNGNTLIAEGGSGRLFEVTREHEIVWEYVSPYRNKRGSNPVDRAYRIPYGWVPLPPPREQTAIVPPDIADWRLPGAAERGAEKIIRLNPAARP